METSDHDLLIDIHRRLKDLDRHLFGNGQPGVIRNMERRLRALEVFRWITVGVLLCAMAILGTQSKSLLAALSGG